MNIQLSKEESTGLVISAAVHFVLLLVAIWFKLEKTEQPAFSFIEVQFGEFRQGRATAMANKRAAKVETARNPARQTDRTPEKEIRQTRNPQEQAKSAELSKQTEEIKDDNVVTTPKSEVLNPQRNSEAAQKTAQSSAKDAKKAEEDAKGAENSGSERGKTGAIDSEQGVGEDDDLSAPYALMWEGEILRQPLTDLKPNFVGDMDAVITVRFQVRPDGTVGQMIPLKKMSPELEREVMRVLRTARFSRLPAGAPQAPQWGTITFRFVLD